MLFTNMINDCVRWTIGILISLVSLIFGYYKLRIMRRKDNIDRTDFKNKLANFSIYIHEGYRLFEKNDRNCKYLLFQIDLINKSTSKITLSPSLNLKIKGTKNKVFLQHNKSFFKDHLHKNIDKFDNNISLEEKGLKTGWIIFKMPSELNDKRVEVIEVICKDTHGKRAKTEFYLLRDIQYENQIP